jgi:hypothetical protein
MCSGCSGDYTGDFDDPSEAAAEPPGNLLPRNPEEPAVHTYRRGAGGRSGFEAGPEAERDSEGVSRPASPFGGVPARGKSVEDACEILVSATRIVEIRVIEANSAEISRVERREASEMTSPGEHLTAGSAKYYRTRRGGAECAADGVQRRLSGVSACIVRAFRKCSRGRSH